MKNLFSTVEINRHAWFPEWKPSTPAYLNSTKKDFSRKQTLLYAYIKVTDLAVFPSILPIVSDFYVTLLKPIPAKERFMNNKVILQKKRNAFK